MKEKAKNKEIKVLFPFKWFGILTAENKLFTMSIFTFQIREITFTIISCCVFWCSRSCFTPLHVLYCWCYVFFFFSFFTLLVKLICQTSHTFGKFFSEEKRSGTMGKRWPPELVWYHILFQSYTITNWNHITAPNWGPDNLLKGQFPQRGDPWPQACQQSPVGWLGHGFRGYMHQHIQMDTRSASLSPFSECSYLLCVSYFLFILQTLVHNTTNCTCCTFKTPKYFSVSWNFHECIK